MRQKYPIKMNWLNFEHRLRLRLRRWRFEEEHGVHSDPKTILFGLDEIIGSETGRGYELDGMVGNPFNITRINKEDENE